MANGVPQHEIARLLSIDPKTLRRRCRKDLDRGLARAETEMASNVLHIAAGRGAPALRAITYALTNRFGWQPVPKLTAN